jgi:voltage-gated potassium channel
MTDPSRAGADRDLYRFVLAQLALPAFVLVAYFALPVYEDGRGAGAPYRIVVFVGGLVGVSALFVHQTRMSSRDEPLNSQMRWLLTAVWITIAFFSIVYLVLARTGTTEIVGLRTKIDALYFTVTVLTSVGFGDIHAVGQTARVVVTIQMVFDVLFVAAAVTALRRSHARRRSVA